MAGPVLADVGGAGDAAFDRLAGFGAFERLAGPGIHLGGDRFPDGLQFLPGALLAAGHEGRAEAGPFLPARDSRSHEAEALLVEFLLAADGVGPEGVAAVDDDVVGIEEHGEAVDHGVGGLPGLDEDDDFAGTLDGLHELLEGPGSDQSTGRVGVFRDELIGLGGGAVVDRDPEAVIGDVEGKVLTHDRKAHESDIGGSV